VRDRVDAEREEEAARRKRGERPGPPLAAQRQREPGQDQRQDAQVADLDARPRAPVELRPAAEETGDQPADPLCGRQRVARGLRIAPVRAGGLACELERRQEDRRGQQHRNEETDGQRQHRGRAAHLDVRLCVRQPDLARSIEGQGKRNEQRGLDMAGERRDGQQHAGERSPDKSRDDGPQRTVQRGAECPEDPGQPTGNPVEIEVAEVGHKGIGEHEGQRTREGCDAPRAQPAHEPEVHACARKPDVRDAQPLQRAVGERGPEQEEQEVGRIEEARLDVAHMGRAAVQVRIPQGQRAVGQRGSREAIRRIEEGDQVTAIRRHPVLTGHDAPEEAQRGEGQHAHRQQVPVPGGYQPAAAVGRPDACQHRQPEHNHEEPAHVLLILSGVRGAI